MNTKVRFIVAKDMKVTKKALYLRVKWHQTLRITEEV